MQREKKVGWIYIYRDASFELLFDLAVFLLEDGHIPIAFEALLTPFQLILGKFL